MLEEDALLRVAKPMLDDPDLVAATGGIVRIVNGRASTTAACSKWASEELARNRAGGRVLQGIPRRADRVEPHALPPHHLRRLRALSPQPRRGRRRFFDRNGGRGPRARRATPRAPPRARRGLPHRLRARSRGMDGGAWRTFVRSADSAPAGSAASRRRSGSTAEWRETALRRRRPCRLSVLHPLRAPRPSSSCSATRSSSPRRRSERSRSPFSAPSSRPPSSSASSSRSRPSRSRSSASAATCAGERSDAFSWLRSSRTSATASYSRSGARVRSSSSPGAGGWGEMQRRGLGYAPAGEPSGGR